MFYSDLWQLGLGGTAVKLSAVKDSRLQSLTSTSCCNTDSKRPHRCCHLWSQTNFGSFQIFHPYTLQWAARCPQHRLFPWGDPGQHPTHGSSCPPEPTIPNGITTGPAVLAQLMDVTDRHTLRPRYICNNGPRIFYAQRACDAA